MKIAFLSNSLSGRGGTETVLTEVVNGLNQKGVESKLFLIGGSNDETWLNNFPNVKVDPIEGNKYIRHILYIIKLAKLLHASKPDIIIGLDNITVFYAKFIKYLLFMNARIGSWLHWSLTKAPKKFLNIADFHLAISSGIQEQFLDNKISIGHKVHLIYNPIKETNEVIPRKEKDIHFLHIGRLQYDGQKRVNDLIRALSQVRGDWKLSIIGDGDDKYELMNLAEELKVNHKIVWYGWKENPWEHVHFATVLLLTSDFEGFPMILGEAMARGIPCISSDCPTGPKDIIIPNVNGWLYPPRDIAKLKDLLQNVVDYGNQLPSAKQVKNSINKFYSSNYMDHLIQTLKNENGGHF